MCKWEMYLAELAYCNLDDAWWRTTGSSFKLSLEDVDEISLWLGGFPLSSLTLEDEGWFSCSLDSVCSGVKQLATIIARTDEALPL